MPCEAFWGLTRAYRLCATLPAVLAVAACGTTTPIQPAASSKSGFDRAVFSGQTVTLGEPTPGESSFRIFQQGATGFVPISGVREDVEDQAVKYCDRAGKSMRGLAQTSATPPYILGNFPRIELVFECISKPLTQAVSSTGALSKYDKLASLKKLLDSATLTQAEFDKEKAKVLAEP